MESSISLEITRAEPDPQFYILDVWALFSSLILKWDGKALHSDTMRSKRIEQYQITSPNRLLIFVYILYLLGRVPIWTSYTDLLTNDSWRVCLLSDGQMRSKVLVFDQVQGQLHPYPGIQCRIVSKSLESRGENELDYYIHR